VASVAERDGRRAVLRAYGHPDIRATHGQTLELCAEAAITPRATCVIGVGLGYDPADLARLRGPVRVEIEAGGRRATGTAVINPGHRAGQRVVLRRAGTGGPETLAVHADLTARDLDRDLVAALAVPGAPVTVTVTEQAPPAPLVLVGTADMAEPAGRTGQLWRYADTVVRLGPGARPAPPQRLLAGGVTVAVLVDSTVDGALSAVDGARSTVDGAGPAGPARGGAPGGAAWLAAAARAGARFAVLVGDRELTAVLLAAGLPGVPALLLGRVDRRRARDPRVAAPVRPAAVPTVLSVPVSDVDTVLGPLAAARPAHPVAVQADPLDVGVALRWTTAAGAPAAVRAFPGRYARVVLAADPVAGPGADLLAAVRALAAAGVPARTLSLALAPLGLDRRAVYAALPPAAAADPVPGGDPPPVPPQAGPATP